jgi:hypothetical protein
MVINVHGEHQIKGGNYEKETDHSNPDVRNHDGIRMHANE